jgi:hypothetical protein
MEIFKSCSIIRASGRRETAARARATACEAWYWLREQEGLGRGGERVRGGVVKSVMDVRAAVGSLSDNQLHGESVRGKCR